MWIRPVSRVSSALLRPSLRSRAVTPARFLNLQEYQSKTLLRDYGVTVQRFVTVDSESDAEVKLRSFKAGEYVVKAQILAGGRGKGHLTSGLQGGVKLTTDPKEVVDFVRHMVGFNLITKQTPKDGVPVQKVMVADSVDIRRETYLAILLDREAGGPVVVASPAGGMDIEEVAETTPELIFKEPVDIEKGLLDEQADRLATSLEFKGDLHKLAVKEIKALFKLFMAVDTTQIEINPLAETTDNLVYAVDAKLNFDDSAKFRQKEIFAWDDKIEDDPREVEAESAGLTYIGMDGNIACLVNGAGLAMATMDIIKLCGGEPANFLDVGGGVQEAAVVKAFQIITADPKVKAILVNIFGGIVNCETIANGLTSAFQKVQLNVPLVVRLEGTNVNQARETLANSNLPIITAKDLQEAAQKAVDCLK